MARAAQAVPDKVGVGCPVLFNRWQTESQFQFQRVTEGEAEEAAPTSPDSDARGWERFIDEESGSPYWWNAQTGESSWEDPASAAEAFADCSIAASKGGVAGTARAARRSSKAAPQSEAVRYSRSLPDSAFANKFGRAVFHNFGRGNEAHQSHSCRVGIEKPVTEPLQPGGAADAPAVATQGERAEPVVVVAPDSGAQASAAPGLADAGVTDVAAAAADCNAEPAEQPEDGAVDLDPKSYKYLPPHWVLQIRAAGLRSSRESSVSSCLQQFL
jgi:hypothetical protein